jgi:deoxyribonuclease V
MIPSFQKPVDAAHARTIQTELRAKLKISDEASVVKTIAGVDVSYDIAANLTRAFIVLLDAQTLMVQASVKAIRTTDFPYVPGLLSFREIPTILEAFQLLPSLPDLLMVDGQGIAHPRRMGIAAHLGVLLDLPAIGVAKSRLTGTYDEPGPRKGDQSPLFDRSERIGTVLRSKDGTLPLFISPGHRIGHEAAVERVMRCLTRYRLPEPTRLADKLSKQKDAQATLL